MDNLNANNSGLTQHIPPKHKHYIRYYGLYSSRGKGKTRAEGKIDHLLPEGFVKKQDTAVTNVNSIDDTPYKKKQRSTWARLIQKVFKVDPLVCHKCGSEMRIKAFIFGNDSLSRIIAWMNQKNKPDLQTKIPPPMKRVIAVC